MTPAELARARELHVAMVAGSARPEDVAELLRLLPAVFEAAGSCGGYALAAEAAAYANRIHQVYASAHDAGIAMSAVEAERSGHEWHATVRAYWAGARRDARG